MRQSEERYISLLTDFGFKRIFGTAPNKDLLINFLNSLFGKEQVIRDVKFLNSENVGDVYTDRKAIFDVYCENEHGEKFIVEMQNAYQKHFKDRSLYYSTFPIKEQAPKGADWDFSLAHVYVVALLNFDMHDDAFDEDSISHDVGLLDKQTKRVFNDKLTFKYVEIAKFDKPLDRLRTVYDKWLYALKNLPRLTGRPKERTRRQLRRRRGHELHANVPANEKSVASGIDLDILIFLVHALNRHRTTDAVRLADQQKDAIRLTCLCDKRRVRPVRFTVPFEHDPRIGRANDQVDPVIVVRVTSRRKRLMRAELRLICRCHRLGILLVRKPVIVPVVGIDAAIDALDVVRPRHEIAVAVKLDLRRYKRGSGVLTACQRWFNSIVKR